MFQIFHHNHKNFLFGQHSELYLFQFSSILYYKSKYVHLCALYVIIRKIFQIESGDKMLFFICYHILSKSDS